MSKKKTTKSIKEEVAQAVDEWIEKELPNIKEKVVRFMNRRTDEIIALIMGFEKDSWGGGWKVDHCNGRSGNSVIGEYIKENAQQEVWKWFSENVGQLPALPKSTVKNLKKEYLTLLERYMRDRLQNAAQERAREEVDKILTEITQKKL